MHCRTGEGKVIVSTAVAGMSKGEASRKLERLPSINETWMPDTLSFLQSLISLLMRLNRASPILAAVSMVLVRNLVTNAESLRIVSSVAVVGGSEVGRVRKESVKNATVTM